MNSNNLLRKQVVSEGKKKKLIVSILLVLSFIYMSINILLGDSGVIRYIELTNKKKALATEISYLQTDNLKIKNQIKLLKENPFYSEKYAREEFGLASPDEYIFQYD